MSDRWVSPGLRSPLTPSFSATTFPMMSPVSQAPFQPGMAARNGIGHMVPGMKSPDLELGSLTTQSLPTALDSTRNPVMFRISTGLSPNGMRMETGIDPLGIGLGTYPAQDNSLLNEVQSSQGPNNFLPMVDALSGGLPLNLSTNTLPSRTQVMDSQGSLCTQSSSNSHPLVAGDPINSIYQPMSNGALSDNCLLTDRPADLVLLPQKRSSGEFPSPVCPLSATPSHFTRDLSSHHSSPMSPANERPLAVASSWRTKRPSASHLGNTLSEYSPTASNGLAIQKSRYSQSLVTASSPVLLLSTAEGKTASNHLPSSAANGSYSIASLPRQPYSPNTISTPATNSLVSKKLQELPETSLNSRVPPNVNPFSDGSFDPSVKIGNLFQHVSMYESRQNQESPPFHTISTLPRESHSKPTPNHARVKKSSVSDDLGQSLGSDLPGDDLGQSLGSDLPGDLSVISPLNFDSGIDDYLHRYLSESQSQESLHQPGKGASSENRKRQASGDSNVSLLSPSSTSPSGFLVNSESRREERVSVCSPSNKTILMSAGNGGCITALSPQLLSPRQEVEVVTVPNGRVSPHSSERVDATSLPQQLVVAIARDKARRPTSLSPRPSQEDNHLPDLLLSPRKSASEGDTPTRERDSGIGETTTVSESISDSSSVFSSREAKFSTTSSCNSPLNSSPYFMSPKASPITPSPLAANSHFGYPYPSLPAETGDDWSPAPSPTGRMSPIPEPYPSLGEEGEYMVQDPELRPPDPPPHSDDINLFPKVPIYEVSGCN